MSEITGQDEARRALEELLDEYADASECAATAYLHGAIIDQQFAEERMAKARVEILAALSAPSLDRGAEEMRGIIASWHEDLALDRARRASKIVVNTSGRDRLQYEATIHRDCARAVRSMSLPVPADLNKGGGK